MAIGRLKYRHSPSSIPPFGRYLKYRLSDLKFDLSNLVTVYLFNKIGVADFLWLAHPTKIVKHSQKDRGDN